MAGTGSDGKTPASKRPAVAMEPPQASVPREEPSPSRPRAGAHYKSSPKRLAAMMAQQADGPEVMHMATPPRKPDLGKAPELGCTVDDLLHFVLKKFQDTEKEATDLEGRIAARLNLMERSVAKFEALHNDLSVYGTIKNFVTQADVDARMTKFEDHVKTLEANSQNLLSNLNEHFTKLTDLEAEFKRPPQGQLPDR